MSLGTPTIPAAQAWLSQPWAHGKLRLALDNAVALLAERGIRPHAGPQPAQVQKSTMGRSLVMSYVLECEGALVELLARWQVGVFASNLGMNRCEIELCTADEECMLLAFHQLWSDVPIPAEERTDEVARDLQRHFERMFAEMVTGELERDLVYFVNLADDALQA